MQDNEKSAVDQRITATNGAYIENVKQEIHIHSSGNPYLNPKHVPSLTEDFVEIPKKEEIKNCLLNSNNSRGILTITAIQGLGGIGKTTLAIVLAHDEEVQKRFSDGILWATLGQEPDKLSFLNSWIQALGDYQSNHTRLETASNHLRTLLYEKRILLVVDDAWNYIDVKPFLVGGSNCQTIITTRKAYIADELGARCTSYSLNVMTEEQSLDLFKNILKDCWDENEKEDALKVAKDVGYLPLALNLATRRRKRGHSWVELHEALEEEIARLSVLESPQRKRKGENSPEASLSLKASLNLSLKDLRFCDEDAYRDFVWLGVLPEDVKINKIMSSTLWEIDHIEAGEILEFLWGEGLLIQDSKIHLKNNELATYRMHDLFHDAARYYLTLSPETKNNTDLLGLGLKLKEAHALLLNRYQSQTQKGLWHTLKDDAYIHSHLTWHLEKAGKIKDIHNLLREENESGKNGWYEALECLALNTVFIKDVIIAWNLSEKESENQIMQGSKTSFIGLEIRYALIYTSINSLSANVSVELLIAFLETKKWSEAKVFEYAQKEPDPYKRTIKLITLHEKNRYGCIKKEEVFEKAFDATCKIKFVEERAPALLNILFYFEDQRKEEVIEKTLDAAYKLVNKSWRAEILSHVASNLEGQRKEQLVEKALDTAFEVEDDYSRAEALSAIASNLDGQRKEEVIEKALEATSKIKDNYIRVEAFSAIASNLSGQRKEEVMEKALDAASKIKGNYERVEAFSAIASNLCGQRKEEVMEKALDAALNLEDESWRGEILSKVLPNLSEKRKEEVIEKALKAALKLEYDHSRAEILSAILPYLYGQKKETVMEIAFDAASNIKDDYEGTRAFSAIASNLDGQRKEEVIKKALEATSKIKDNYKRVEAFSAIASNLSGQRKEEVLKKALGAASKIKSNYERVKVFSNILPHFHGQRKEEVIEKALEESLNFDCGEIK